MLFVQSHNATRRRIIFHSSFHSNIFKLFLVMSLVKSQRIVFPCQIPLLLIFANISSRSLGIRQEFPRRHLVRLCWPRQTIDISFALTSYPRSHYLPLSFAQPYTLKFITNRLNRTNEAWKHYRPSPRFHQYQFWYAHLPTLANLKINVYSQYWPTTLFHVTTGFYRSLFFLLLFSYSVLVAT